MASGDGKIFTATGAVAGDVAGNEGAISQRLAVSQIAGYNLGHPTYLCQCIDMEISREYKLRETEPLDEVEAVIEGHVFHVTHLAYLPSILECEEIRPNRDGTLLTTFGFSENSYFRKCNCVSLFDYREKPPDDPLPFRKRCDPFRPARPPSEGVAILIMEPLAYVNIIPWTKWKDEKVFGEVVVPYVEVGYPGPLALSLIAEIIKVEITKDPKSHTAMLSKAWDSKNH